MSSEIANPSSGWGSRTSEASCESAASGADRCDDDGFSSECPDQVVNRRTKVSFVESSVTLQSGTAATGETEKQRVKHRCGWVGRAAELPEDPNESNTRPITTRDVADIFRASETTCEVVPEEIARVKKMHDKISSGVNFCFDYYSLLIIAGVISGLGLVTDSSTTVISSMLISPLMGPVVGMAYGVSVWDWKLVWRSVRNECISLIICIIIGLIVGSATAFTDLVQDWPTEEMYSRGTIQNLVVGIPIAFFSGLGVALAVLDDQTSSLVGVAISASLLPPAVNCGLLWICGLVHENRLTKTQHEEPGFFVRMGIISFGLTVVNIVVIWISSMLMFRVKEVLPIKKKIFWKDLKTARRIYQKRALLPSTHEPEIEEEHAVQPSITRSMSN